MWRGHLLLLLIGLGVAGSLPLAGTQVFLDRPEQHRAMPAQPGDVRETDVAISGHPLTPVLNFARQTERRLQDNLHSYRGRLIKRERIDGRLQEERSIEMRVREGPRLAVAMDFLLPADVAGRRILYVQGEHDGRMLVRKGGRRLDFVVLRLNPLGSKAQAESLVPLTQIGFRRLLAALVSTLTSQIEADPQAANTQVQWNKEAELDGRPCQIIRVLHPERDEALLFHTAAVYIDQQLGVPVRIEAYGWPEQPADSLPLIAEYTYTHLELNASLPGDCFDPATLRGD